ncbi:hypothetical protein [Stieleria varia]|uniref:Uncharacterized protein n=1 Tax=Stieleria varia TaxID=2528005 RepID=A0A5C6AR82_9BACT|nr:hypothetical protein [Stieleria varia]TWU02543.1 hypothetical protein Pla52n_35930 [Stieleria varia]
MNPKTETNVAKKLPSDSHWSEEPWARVKAAITERWPHLDQRDVESLRCDVFEIEHFLRVATETSAEEIQAVVREFAPAPSVLQRAGHLGEQVSQHIVPPVQSAIERVRYEVDERPGVVGGLIFVTGVAWGVLATAAYFRSQQKESLLQSCLPNAGRR